MLAAGQRKTKEPQRLIAGGRRKGINTRAVEAGRARPLHTSQLHETLPEVLFVGEACTHVEGQATLSTIDIPSVRPRETAAEQPPSGHSSSSAQARRVAMDKTGNVALPAKRVKVEESADSSYFKDTHGTQSQYTDGLESTSPSSAPAADQGLICRAPARCIATRTLHIPDACWSAATPQGIQVEFWQVGGSGPAAYLPENLAVQCLLRGGDNPDELALDLSPRPFMLVTPVGGERNTQNAATFVGLLRHLTESKQLAKLPIRTSHITVTRQDKLDPSAHARVHEERTYEESSKERQDESAVSVFKETRETLVLYPPACWALKSCVLSTAPVQVMREDYLVACFVRCDQAA